MTLFYKLENQCSEVLVAIKKAFTLLLTAILLAGCSHVLDVENTDIFVETNTLFAALNLPTAIDGRARFNQLFCARLTVDGKKLGYNRKCADYVNNADLNSSSKPTPPADKTDIRMVMIGGIFSQCINNKVGLLTDTVQFIAANPMPGLGNIRFETVNVSGYSSSAHNAKIISNTLLGLELSPSERVVIVSYSKGTSDVIEALATYQKAAERVDATISVAGVVLGSPLAKNQKLLSTMLQTIKTKCSGLDGQGLESITPEARLAFLSKNDLPTHIRYYSLAGDVPRSETSMALLPLRDWLSLHTSASDAQVPATNAVLPNSVLLGFLKADHWAIAMPFVSQTPLLAKSFLTKNKFPREIMLSAALEIVISDMQP